MIPLKFFKQALYLMLKNIFITKFDEYAEDILAFCLGKVRAWENSFILME